MRKHSLDRKESPTKIFKKGDYKTSKKNNI